MRLSLAALLAASSLAAQSRATDSTATGLMLAADRPLEGGGAHPH